MFPVSDEHTVFSTTKSGICKACREPDDDFGVVATTDIGFVICQKCLRGATMAVAKEHLRRRKVKPQQA